jgi:hypothetical protein
MKSGVLEKTEALRASLSLPSRLPVLSMADHGGRVLAIDSANAVFLSVDRGEHWLPVPAQWAGRAVKADLVRFSGGPFRLESPKMALRAQPDAVTVPTPAAAFPAKPAPSSTAISSSSAAEASREQSAGDQLTGIVTDFSGTAVPGATVTLSDEGKGQATKKTAVTGADGGYLFRGLPAARYSLETAAPGFQRQKTSSVEVSDAGVNVRNVTLQVGAMSETVEVSGNAVTIESDRATPLAKAGGRNAAAPAAFPVFAITTDSGEQWTSADGMTWKRK